MTLLNYFFITEIQILGSGKILGVSLKYKKKMNRIVWVVS